MNDFYQDIYAPRVHSTDPDRSCLALFPDGSTATVTGRELNDAWRKNIASPNHPGIPQMGQLGAIDGYGYDLTFFFAASADGGNNPSASAFHRACLLGDRYAEPLAVQGPLYLSDSFRNLKLADWKALKYCWRSQTKEGKAKWKRAKEAMEQSLETANSGHRQRISAVQTAKSPRSVVYIDSNRYKCTELLLSRREIMLIAHPLLDSMEGTGVVDSVECCADDPELCLSKYTDEYAAYEKLCGFQDQNNIEPGSFRPDIALPLSTIDMDTFIWVQSDSEGCVNKLATKLLRMKILGDAIVARRKGHGLEDTMLADLDAMLERVKDSKKVCSLCGSQGKVKVCSKCNYTVYCSEKCQHEDWAAHKDICVNVESLWTSS
jgi:MYND finger